MACPPAGTAAAAPGAYTLQDLVRVKDRVRVKFRVRVRVRVKVRVRAMVRRKGYLSPNPRLGLTR